MNRRQQILGQAVHDLNYECEDDALNIAIVAEEYDTDTSEVRHAYELWQDEYSHTDEL